MKKDNTQIIQAMPLIQGKVNLVSGTHKVNELIHCVEGGTFTITWETGATATISMLSGQDYAFDGSITIADGTYHIS